ncbi:MAG: stage II sporulation protein M [Bacteroidales bacterium]|jgi:uncharacterized membrane protein SpoIIM required for sporulation|nr:stage II sporulation protein M [Bacteroidales bacterium]
MAKKHFFIIAFLCWLLPFVLRIFLVKIPEMDMSSAEISENSIDRTIQFLLEGNRQKAFLSVFCNNILGCVINILGGVLLGFGTLLNLLLNGFLSADIFVSSYHSGVSAWTIMKITLPHSIEFIGFWLSGATGFYIAWHIIQAMRNKDSFSRQFYKTVGWGSLLTVVIISVAAYAEIYISMDFVK